MEDNYYLKYERFGKDEDLYRKWGERNSSDVMAKVVMKGVYEGRHFMIAAHRSGVPTAYIEVLDDDNGINDQPENWRAESLGSVNGSSNYYGEAYWDENDHRKYIGWDYHHAGDYSGYQNPTYWHRPDNGHKWSLVEILMEIAKASTEINLENFYRYRVQTAEKANESDK